MVVSLRSCRLLLGIVGTIGLTLLPHFGTSGRQWVPLVELAPSKKKIKTLVIDPGHGGVDGGCVGKYAVEKQVALSVSLLLGELIERNYPDVRVVYVRKRDQFVGLSERAVLANKEKADLFISIHCNSLPGAVAYGTETYVLGLHRTQEQLDVALRENSSIVMEADYQGRYGGFDPKAPETQILLSMYQNAYLEQSISLANKVELELSKGPTRRHSRGVRQAGFLVLRAVAMPSILIELGFLTNPTEEAFLASPQGQQQLAEGIFRAFSEYKAEVEGTAAVAASVARVPGEVPAVDFSDNEVVFSVQVASSDSPMKADGAYLRQFSDLRVDVLDNRYKYLSGRYRTFSEAEAALKEYREKNLTNTFIVAYRGTTRVKLSEARSSSVQQ